MSKVIVKFTPELHELPKRVAGSFPGNIVDYKVGEVSENGGYPIKVTTMFGDGCREINGALPDGQEILAEGNVGLTISRTVWLNTKPRAGQKEPNNKIFTEFFKNLGVEFTEKGGVIELRIPEREEVIGKGVVGDLQWRYPSSYNQETQRREYDKEKSQYLHLTKLQNLDIVEDLTEEQVGEIYSPTSVDPDAAEIAAMP